MLIKLGQNQKKISQTKNNNQTHKTEENKNTSKSIA